ncbi:hypothetical protein GSI_09164 [Ganoderma sinense ZZ0214-1]|uniref:Uncharacterized protein n=1 Tax=Ganoderma sinense ZZ0214-1 TaxID=1077348 RepID=A0A2G8S5R5_9APHY|nr:hypothetical protein GSI_09164 [Ganoderma sinense ZZ0214-1]
MQTGSAHTSPPPGAATAVNNAQDAPMKGSDVLQISLMEMLARNPDFRFDWDQKTFAIVFNLNDANGPADAVNKSVPFPRNVVTSFRTHRDVLHPPLLRQSFRLPPSAPLSRCGLGTHSAAQCFQNLYGIPDGASRQTILAQANRVDANGAVNDNAAQPRPCEIHEAQNARGSAAAAGAGSDASTGTPRCTRPLPRRNQIVNGSNEGAPATTTTPNSNPNTSAAQAGATYDNTNTPPTPSGDDDDDDVPLDVLKREVAAKRKRKAAATFEPVIKTEPVEKESGKRLHPERHQFKIRGMEERVRWYYTESKRPIDAVPSALLKPRHEALYVHRFCVPFVGWQAWIYVKFATQGQASAGTGTRATASSGAAVGGTGGIDSRVGNGGGNGNGNGSEGEGERQAGEWRRVEIGDPHPRLEGLVLHMLDEDSGPRWVKPQSARTYASGKHKRARWARNM